MQLFRRIAGKFFSLKAARPGPNSRGTGEVFSLETVRRFTPSRIPCAQLTWTGPTKTGQGAGNRSAMPKIPTSDNIHYVNQMARNSSTMRLLSLCAYRPFRQLQRPGGSGEGAAAEGGIADSSNIGYQLSVLCLLFNALSL